MSEDFLVAYCAMCERPWRTLSRIDLRTVEHHRQARDDEPAVPSIGPDRLARCEGSGRSLPGSRIVEADDPCLHPFVFSYKRATP